MIVRTLEDTVGSAAHVSGETWSSRRLLLAGDGVGFSLHDTVIGAGTESRFWYRHHIEAVYCIEGEGTVEEVDTGVVHEVRPGTVYVLDRHDRHIVRARTRMRMVCVFNPPCTGQETHDEHGTYPLLVGAVAEVAGVTGAAEVAGVADVAEVAGAAGGNGAAGVPVPSEGGSP